MCAAGHTGRADVAQLVERDLPKVDVASSSLVIRSTPGTSYGQDVPSLRTYDVPRPPPRLGAVEFQGFPVAALDFYDDLEVDNTKSFWEAHKHVYAESVRGLRRRRPRDRVVRRDQPAGPAHRRRLLRGLRHPPGRVSRGGRPRHLRPRARGAGRRARERRLRGRRRHPQDPAARLRRRPPAHRAAAAQGADTRSAARLRAGDPHPRGAGPGARGLAHAAPVRGVGPAARPGLSDARPTTRTRSSSGVRSRG